MNVTKRNVERRMTALHGVLCFFIKLQNMQWQLAKEQKNEGLAVHTD